MNTEFNYRTQIEGNTPWESIKHLKSFWNGRKRAEALEEINDLKLQAKKAKLAHLKEVGPVWEAIELESEIMEIESSMADVREAYMINSREILILEKLLAEMYAVAEPTRIEGYDDDMMIEANSENEFATWVCREIQAEIAANGRSSAARLRNAMSSNLAINALKAMRVLPPEFNGLLVGHNDVSYLLSDNKNAGFFIQEDIRLLPTEAEVQQIINATQKAVATQATQ